ncbi:unnamed protein product [Paramecium sonneborni]|uniref:Uncharacterized protein n=1 Tax=Paramecium sonneborni TaxID=65129 RepID=A0A8S1RMG2_9CILI|nr:unnamed protein product [Paramecium sonneborni]
MGITCLKKKNVQLEQKQDKSLKESNLKSAELYEPKMGQNENKQINQYHEFKIWNFQQNRWLQLKSFQVNFTLENQIKYIYNGEILRIEEQKAQIGRTEVLTNLEQIKFLQWRGDYGKNLKKNGRWTAFWKSKQLKKVGGYYLEDGSKQGLWKEIMKNYCSQCKIFEMGEYQKNQKIGQWDYIYKKRKIGGGLYNEQAQKNGKWIELINGFHENRLVTLRCEYKNGKKVGIEDIWYEDHGNILNQQILYDILCVFVFLVVADCIVKRFDDQVGQLDGMLRWIIFFQINELWLIQEWQKSRELGYFVQKQKDVKINYIVFIISLFLYISGGGQYDEGGNEYKLGDWVEISDEYNDQSKEMFFGAYDNGKKVGVWNILYINEWKQKYIIQLQSQYNSKNSKISRGELYDIIKDGMWDGLQDEFKDIIQLIHKGEYNNGKKVGQWDIFLNWNGQQKIGGGSYENGVKFGNWIDLDCSFEINKQVTYTGQYNDGFKDGDRNLFNSNKCKNVLQK